MISCIESLNGFIIGDMCHLVNWMFLTLFYDTVYRSCTNNTMLPINSSLDLDDSLYLLNEQLCCLEDHQAAWLTLLGQDHRKRVCGMWLSNYSKRPIVLESTVNLIPGKLSRCFWALQKGVNAGCRNRSGRFEKYLSNVCQNCSAQYKLVATTSTLLGSVNVTQL